ncbi:Protein unc-80-like protein [Bienertia sinuspersici]
MRKVEVEGRSIQLSDIHIFWRTLKVKEVILQHQRTLHKEIHQLGSTPKKNALNVLRVVDNLLPLSLFVVVSKLLLALFVGEGVEKGKIHVESSNNIPRKNAQKIPSHISPYVGDLPTFILPFISNINNVNGDGNCGYRVVARCWIF